MADKNRKYTQVTEDVFECMKKGIERRGAQIDGDTSGTFKITAYGFDFKFKYSWDGSETLNVICTDKPFVVGYGKIWDTVDPGVTSCGGVVS
jgi:hypothetical protein